jgi:hypothetical protein
MRSFAFMPSADPATNRWLVYYRLQELGIDCECASCQPLIVNPHTPSEVLQAWSVCRQVNAPREGLVDWLDRCWQCQSGREDRALQFNL